MAGAGLAPLPSGQAWLPYHRGTPGSFTIAARLAPLNAPATARLAPLPSIGSREPDLPQGLLYPRLGQQAHGLAVARRLSRPGSLRTWAGGLDGSLNGLGRTRGRVSS